MEIPDLKNWSVYLPIDRINWWLTDDVTGFWLSLQLNSFYTPMHHSPLHVYATAYIIDKNQKARSKIP